MWDKQRPTEKNNDAVILFIVGHCGRVVGTGQGWNFDHKIMGLGLGL